MRYQILSKFAVALFLFSAPAGQGSCDPASILLPVYYQQMHDAIRRLGSDRDHVGFEIVDTSALFSEAFTQALFAEFAPNSTIFEFYRFVPGRLELPRPEGYKDVDTHRTLMWFLETTHGAIANATQELHSERMPLAELVHWALFKFSSPYYPRNDSNPHVDPARILTIITALDDFGTTMLHDNASPVLLPKGKTVVMRQERAGFYFDLPVYGVFHHGWQKQVAQRGLLIQFLYHSSELVGPPPR